MPRSPMPSPRPTSRWSPKPAQAIAALYQIASHSAGLSLQNAVYSQQALNQISTAVVSKAVSMIMAIEDKKGI